MSYEELNSMTHEDLIRYVLETQEKLKKAEAEKKTNFELYSREHSKFESFKEAVKSVVILVD